MNFIPLDDQLVNVAQIVRKAPKLTLRRAYMRAYREWCQQTQWLRLALPGSTAQGVRTYLLGDDDNLDVMGVRAVSVTKTATNGATQTWGVAPSDSSQWPPNWSEGLPRRYCYVPEGSIALDPTPDAVYGLLITLIVAPKETSTSVPADPLVKYSNDIEAGALAYLLSIPGQPWTDTPSAHSNMQDFKVGVANGKAEVQRAFNTGSQRVRPRSFGAGRF